MNPNIEDARQRSLDLLETTRRATRAVLTHLNPELVVHMDELARSVRDVIGHLGVWNVEAARSLSAYSKGKETSALQRIQNMTSTTVLPPMPAAPGPWTSFGLNTVVA